MSKYDKCKKQLGMTYGRARNKLVKTLMFSFVQTTKRDICFRCGLLIETEQELSIEHKTAWLDSISPAGLFFDLENIAFSHFRCNVRAGRRPYQKYFTREEKLAATNNRTREYKRRVYTTEKRQEKYKRTGH